jgi:hypothetical protein
MLTSIGKINEKVQKINQPLEVVYFLLSFIVSLTSGLTITKKLARNPVKIPLRLASKAEKPKRRKGEKAKR